MLSHIRICNFTLVFSFLYHKLQLFYITPDLHVVKDFWKLDISLVQNVGVVH
jgi:hypothetical protein